MNSHQDTSSCAAVLELDAAGDAAAVDGNYLRRLLVNHRRRRSQPPVITAGRDHSGHVAAAVVTLRRTPFLHVGRRLTALGRRSFVAGANPPSVRRPLYSGRTVRAAVFVAAVVGRKFPGVIRYALAAVCC